MQNDYMVEMGLKLLQKGPIGQSELNKPLYAHVMDIVSEPHSVRIVFAVHSEKSPDVIFEDRIWDPAYNPAKFLNRNLKLSISSSRDHSRARLKLWSRILDVPFEETFDMMHDRDLLKVHEISMYVMVCAGSNSIQYIKILSTSMKEKPGSDKLWMLADTTKPVEPPQVPKFKVHENAVVKGDYHMAMLTRLHEKRMDFLERHPDVWEGMLDRLDNLIADEAMIAEQGEANQRDWEEHLQKCAPISEPELRV